MSRERGGSKRGKSVLYGVLMGKSSLTPEGYENSKSGANVYLQPFEA